MGNIKLEHTGGGGSSKRKIEELGPGKESLRLDTRGMIHEKDTERWEVIKIKNLGSVKHPLKRAK